MKYFEKYQDETTYLDLVSIGKDVICNNVIGRPPVKGSPEAIADKKSSKQIAYHLSDKDKSSIIEASNSIFSFDAVLGSRFNAEALPKTAAFSQKVDEDISVAEEAAKKTFQYPRPLHNFGYSYPSGYATRAHHWAVLLGGIFPNCKTALKNQAQEHSKIRVMLGKQYISAITAGKLYGKYLAQQFLKNPDFVNEWDEVKKEILSVIPAETKPVVTPVEP
ncbi:MAG: hypothetical protein K2W99_03110 [Chthoniobacterales bacterium]|nr:hypothetical protein [Chthoniobacterales bacterium]